MSGANTNVRISASAAVVLRRLSKSLRQSQTALVERAISDLQTRVFWEESTKAIERLRADPAAWQAYQAEIRSIDGWPGGPHRPMNPQEEESW